MTYNWPLNGDFRETIQGADLTNFGCIYETEVGTTNQYLYMKDAYLKAPSGVYFNGDFTISVWVKVITIRQWARVLDFGGGPDSDNVFLTLDENSTGRPFIIILNGAFEGTRQYTNTAIPLNKWVHLVTSVTGTTGKVYLDGVNTGTVTLNIAANGVRTSNYIGKSNWPGDALSDAYIRSLKIFNVGLSAGQVNELYNCS